MHCNLKLLWKKRACMIFCGFSCCNFSCLLSSGIFHLCVYFRWIPTLVFPPDAKHCIYPRFPPPVTFCIFPLIWHSISIWCYIFYKISFHFGARDYILCYNFMFGYLCTCTRSNKKNLIKNDEKHHFSKMLSWHVIPRMLICYIIDRWAVLLCL